MSRMERIGRRITGRQVRGVEFLMRRRTGLMRIQLIQPGLVGPSDLCRPRTQETLDSATVMNSKNRALDGKHPGSLREEWKQHYRTLQLLRERLVSGREVHREEASEPLTLDTNDMADCATDETDCDLAFSLLSQKESALQEVDAALGRMEKGTYGICEESGQPIPEERLRAVPWARYTKEVQERLEKAG
jgi:RNA polymerase-binding transcription factor DksA